MPYKSPEEQPVKLKKAIITALERNEYPAMMAQFDSAVPVEIETNTSLRLRAIIGRINSVREGIHDVLLTVLPTMGPTAAATHAAYLTQIFPGIATYYMTGIAAGHKDKIQLGDVIFSDKVYDHSFGKVVDDSYEGMIRRGRIIDVNPNLVTTSRSLRDKFAMQDGYLAKVMKTGYLKATKNNPMGIEWGIVEDSVPQVHIGTIATGPQVVKLQPFMDKLLKEKSIYTLEMETHAAHAAVEGAGHSLMGVRSYCDFGNADKNDTWQNIAALNAAILTHTHIASGSGSITTVPWNPAIVEHYVNALAHQGKTTTTVSVLANHGEMVGPDSRPLQKKQSSESSPSSKSYYSYEDALKLLKNKIRTVKFKVDDEVGLRKVLAFEGYSESAVKKLSMRINLAFLKEDPASTGIISQDGSILWPNIIDSAREGLSTEHLEILTDLEDQYNDQVVMYRKFGILDENEPPSVQIDGESYPLCSFQEIIEGVKAIPHAALVEMAKQEGSWSLELTPLMDTIRMMELTNQQRVFTEQGDAIFADGYIENIGTIDSWEQGNPPQEDALGHLPDDFKVNSLEGAKSRKELVQEKGGWLVAIGKGVERPYRNLEIDDDNTTNEVRAAAHFEYFKQHGARGIMSQEGLARYMRVVYQGENSYLDKVLFLLGTQFVDMQAEKQKTIAAMGVDFRKEYPEKPLRVGRFAAADVDGDRVCFPHVIDVF